MSLKLTSYFYDKDRQCFVSKYDLSHQTVGAKGTILKLSIIAFHLSSGVMMEIHGLNPECKDLELTFAKMAEWLERASIAIKERSDAYSKLSEYFNSSNSSLKDLN
jgi:hypothetical protein